MILVTVSYVIVIDIILMYVIWSFAMNPFVYGRVVDREDFCSRPMLVEKLSAEIKRGQNVYIQGERRTGKTSLIYETVRRNRRYRPVYIDLLEVKTVDSLLKRVVSALVSSQQSQRFSLDRLFRGLAQLRPVVSLDPISGLPTISLDASVPTTPDSLSSVLDLVVSHHKRSKPLIVVFDEFQDILNLKNAREVLALMRGRIQFHSAVAYVFAGSVRNRMDGIFTDAESAFFQSALPIRVGPLDGDLFCRFIEKRFRAGNRTISKKTIRRIFDICAHIPGDIQQLCGAVWETTKPGETDADDPLPEAMERIFAQEIKTYETILNIVSGRQLNVLAGIARFDGKRVLSNDFLRGVGIVQPSAVQAAVKRLTDLRILCKTDGRYRFVNPFFRAWLLHRNF